MKKGEKMTGKPRLSHGKMQVSKINKVVNKKLKIILEFDYCKPKKLSLIKNRYSHTLNTVLITQKQLIIQNLK